MTADSEKSTITGNHAADKLLRMLGENFTVLPWATDSDNIEMISLVENDVQGDSITIAFRDSGEPPFVFNMMVAQAFAAEGDDES